MLLGLALRLWGINYDLPYVYHPDEPIYLNAALNIFKTGDLNPHRFDNLSLIYYINGLALIPYYFVGKLLGIFAARADVLPLVSLDMGVTFAPLPSTVLLGRIITVLFGLGNILLTFLIGKQLSGKAIIGILASILVAIAQPNVGLSHFVTPDTFATFFILLAFLASVLVYQQGKTRYYVLAGLCVGLAAASKFNGALIVVSLLLAHFLRYGRQSLKRGNLYLALALCGVSFIAATPMVLLNFSEFLSVLNYQSSHYASGHPGMEGNTFIWYLSFMWHTGGVIYVLAALGMLYGIYLRSKETILLSSFPLVYYIFINNYTVRNDRTFLPMAPFLFLLAAWFLDKLYGKARALLPKAWRFGLNTALACITIAALILPASVTVNDTVLLTTVNSRETARVWINSNLPPGAKIMIEAYSPFIDTSRFSVQAVGRMIDYPPEWYIEHGIEYLVFSQGMFGRFFQEPENYSTEVSQYNELFSRFVMVKSFTDGNYEIRIYKVT